MQALRLHSYKAVRLDEGITGADMNRPGFLALIRDQKKDKTISHLLIHRRDRFARSEDAIKMVALEQEIRTPDHTHAPAAVMAMRLGKPVY